MAGNKMNEEKKIKKDGMNMIGRLGKCLKVPIRVFSLALDFYVRSITDCSGRAQCGPSKAQLHGLPKNLSTSSSSKSAIQYTDEDFRELMRAASTRSLNDNNIKTLQLEVPRDCYGGGKIARSFTSGMGRIDEDNPCEFGEEVRVDVNINVLYPRSRSHAVTR